MHDTVHGSTASRIEAERKLLAALCQPWRRTEMREHILRNLKTYRFVVPDHDVVYRAIIKLPAGDNADLLGALTQAVTRLGFPDLDVREIVEEPAPSDEEVTSLLAQL
jgi:hypothetical protein